MAAAIPSVGDITRFLREFAPVALAEAWDNVGLLLGDETAPARRVLTCLTLTEDVAAEAATTGVGLVVSHHPVLFKAIKRITSETAEGRTLLTLLKAGVAVYSPHTAYDSAADGINSRLAIKLDLADIQPIRPAAEGSPIGSGRLGRLTKSVSLREFLDHVRTALKTETLGYVGDLQEPVRKVAVACGSAAEFLEDADRKGCDVLVTGEARFHACLEARALGIAMILAGHYATERPAVEDLAHVIAERFPGLHSTPSSVERDPLNWSTR